MMNLIFLTFLPMSIQDLVNLVGFYSELCILNVDFKYFIYFFSIALPFFILMKFKLDFHNICNRSFAMSPHMTMF